MSNGNLPLSTRALAKTYPLGEMKLNILSSVDFQVGAGEFVSIQGESGCGKSTLLNLLAGLETPDAGQVFWSGADIRNLSSKQMAKQRARHIGIVFQAYYLVPELDAMQNIMLSARILDDSRSSTKQREQQAVAMLERVGLGPRRHQMPNTLSGGERQRIAIARALATGPSVVLADEPTGNLDERTGNSVMDLLQQLCRETQTALVLVTHNKEHAARADRQLTLRDGVFDSTEQTQIQPTTELGR